MRTRALVVAAIVTLPALASAQRLPLPRIIRRPPTTEPQPLPPEAPSVTRTLAYRRSRWSTEAYPFMSYVQMPTSVNGNGSYTALGTGTHGDYRVTDYWAATLDGTVSYVGGPLVTGTAEVGTRYRPMPFGDQLRPFFDVRVTYAYMYDALPYASRGSIDYEANAPTPSGARYSRGFGAMAGTGLEYSFTRTLAFTTSIAMLRNRMAIFQLDQGTLPNDGRFTMTTYRYSIGIRYNPIHLLQLAQNPRQ